MGNAGTSALNTGIIVVYSLKIVSYLIFLGLYIRRVNKLDNQASVSELYNQKQKTLRIKLGLIILLILFFLIHILLAELDHAYWMYKYHYFQLVDILGLVDMLLQIYILTKQHKKMARRTRSVLVFWIFMSITEIIIIIIVEVTEPTAGIALVVLQAITSIVLVLVSLSTNNTPNPTLQLMNSTLGNQNLLPIIPNDASRASFSGTDKIYISFNKDFEVIHTGKSTYQFYFKIAVYVGDQPSYIITKTELQFAELSKIMREFFPQSEDAMLRPSSRKTKSNISEYGQDKQKYYQQYLLKLTKENKYYVQPFLNFLKINPDKRGLLLRPSHVGVLRKSTRGSSQEELRAKQPFFNVSIKNKKIHVSNYQILQIIVNKSVAEIKAFHSRLLSERRLKQQILSDESHQINEVVQFIDKVVNSKSLWRSFAEWMCLGSALEDKIYHMFDFWNLGFKHIQMNIIGHQKTFDKQGSVITLYLLSMQIKNAPLDLHQGTTLKKRYNDFLRLDRGIKKFIAQNKIQNVQMPSLPRKISPFGSKTSPIAHRTYFDLYIHQILKIQRINHCIKFLEFLQVENDNLPDEFYHFQESDRVVKQERTYEQTSKILNSLKVQELEMEDLS